MKRQTTPSPSPEVVADQKGRLESDQAIALTPAPSHHVLPSELSKEGHLAAETAKHAARDFDKENAHHPEGNRLSGKR